MAAMFFLDGTIVAIRYKGFMTVEEAGGKEIIIETEDLPTKKTKDNIHPVKSNGVTYYAAFPSTVKWLNGEGKMHLYTLRTEEVEDDLTTKIITEAELKYIHDINDKINNAKTAKDLDKIFDEHIDYISKTHTVTKNGKTYKYKLIDNETFLLEELNPIDDIIQEKKNTR